MINFEPVSFIMKIANLGNICKHSHGEACLSERGKYQYSALGRAVGAVKSFHCRRKAIIFNGSVLNPKYNGCVIVRFLCAFVMEKNTFFELTLKASYSVTTIYGYLLQINNSC